MHGADAREEGQSELCSAGVAADGLGDGVRRGEDQGVEGEGGIEEGGELRRLSCVDS